MKIHEDHYAVLVVSDPDFGKLGYLLIDTTYEGRSVGGVRILPDVSLAEISHMSRAMTKKYLFSGIRCGGAKAGLILSPNAARHRTKALLAFGRALFPYINNGFWPGCDMGSSPQDIRTILRGAGIISFQKEEVTSHKYTAWTVIGSIEVALKRKNIAWKDAKIAIEGFGNVGGVVAKMAAECGARIVAVSNISGAVHDPEGLDIPALLEQRSREGSDFIKNHASTGPKESIFSVVCDVFVPCARCWTLDESKAKGLRASILVSAANVPMTVEVEDYLWKKGMMIVPDSVANCGGVVGTTLARHMDDSKISSVFENKFKPRVEYILDQRMTPSRYLEQFVELRKKQLSDALRPRIKGPAELALDRLNYHLVERFSSGSEVVRNLFPS